MHNSYESIKEYINSEETGNGCKLIIAKSEIIKELKKRPLSKIKFKIQCKCGNVFERNFSNFKNNKKQCIECSKNDKKIKIQEVKNMVEKEGYKLLSTKCENAKSYLEVECPNGHTYDVRYYNFQSGKRCPICAKEKRADFFRFSYEDVKNYIEIESNSGYKLLSKDYKNTNQKLKIQCDKGHIYEARFSNFKNLNQRCPYCNGGIEYPYEKIQKYIEKNNYKSLTPKTEYVNTSTFNLLLECPERHQYTTNFNNFQQGHRCPECEIKLRPTYCRLDGTIVYQAFINAGLEPCFKPEDYIKYSLPLPYICPVHKDKGILYKSYTALMNKTGCPYCGKISTTEKNRINPKKVYDDFYEKGLILLEEYNNNSKPIKYYCIKHSDIIQKTSYASFKISKCCCELCRLENSVRHINDKFRSSLKKWRQTSEEKNNYKCVITKNNDYQVHHLYSFNNIIKDTLNELNLPIFQDTSQYQAKELKSIKTLILKYHKSNLGICLNVKIHNLFHNLYRKGNNTKEQFKEFVIRLESGEFSSFLKENNLELDINYDILKQYN